MSKPTFHKLVTFSPDLFAIELKKSIVKIDKPIYVGAAILDISKTKMYEFHYGFVKKNFPTDVALCYTDTDSYIYEFRGIDIYEVMKEHHQEFDTSDYPENNIFGIKQLNKKKPGLIKDELNGEIMTKVITIRSKMYAMKTKRKNKKICKGIKNYIINNKITFEDYENCLFNKQIISCEQNVIRSKLHKLYTLREKKIALNPADEKRYICNNNVDTLAWGHMDIDQ